MSYQQTIVLGNLGQDPVTKYTQNGKMLVELSVAENRRVGGEDTTQWWRCTGWEKTAETLDKLAQDGHLGKGRQVLVIGRASAEAWIDKNSGEARFAMTMSIDRLQLAGGSTNQSGE